MTLRPALPEDCARLAAIDAYGNPSPWTPKQFESALDSPREQVWLAEDKGQTVGFIVWQTVLDESELHLIAVAPEHRRQGIACRLLAHWLQNSAASGCTRLLLEVRAGNTAAQQLYLKHGFTLTGRRKNYYPLPESGFEDAVLMEKTC